MRLAILHPYLQAVVISVDQGRDVRENARPERTKVYAQQGSGCGCLRQPLRFCPALNSGHNGVAIWQSFSELCVLFGHLYLGVSQWLPFLAEPRTVHGRRIRGKSSFS